MTAPSFLITCLSCCFDLREICYIPTRTNALRNWSFNFKATNSKEYWEMSEDPMCLYPVNAACGHSLTISVGYDNWLTVLKNILTQQKAAVSVKLLTSHKRILLLLFLVRLVCCSHKSTPNQEVFLSNEEVKPLMTVHVRHSNERRSFNPTC